MFSFTKQLCKLEWNVLCREFISLVNVPLQQAVIWGYCRITPVDGNLQKTYLHFLWYVVSIDQIETWRLKKKTESLAPPDQKNLNLSMKDELIIWNHPRGLEGLEEKIERLLEKDWKASFTVKTVGPVTSEGKQPFRY